MPSNFDKTWTLFLDRDGVINDESKGQYVLSVEQFQFLDGVLEALALAHQLFHRIIVVTNQRCVGLNLLAESTLHQIHQHMITEIQNHGGRIDAVYYAPSADTQDPLRKPNIGMALQAQADYPDIDFSKSIMIGNTYTDLEFAKALHMYSVYINGKILMDNQFALINYNSASLLGFMRYLVQQTLQI